MKNVLIISLSILLSVGAMAQNYITLVKPYGQKYWGFIDNEGNMVTKAQFKSVGPFIKGLAWAKNMNKKVGYINIKGEWLIKPIYDAAKNFDTVSGLAFVKLNGIWSYLNTSGEIIKIEGIEDQSDFHNGLAIGKINDKAGFFNSKGEWVIAPKFESVHRFKNGYAAAKAGGKWGFIDTEGNWVVKPIYAGVKDMEIVK